MIQQFVSTMSLKEVKTDSSSSASASYSSSWKQENVLVSLEKWCKLVASLLGVIALLLLFIAAALLLQLLQQHPVREDRKSEVWIGSLVSSSHCTEY